MRKFRLYDRNLTEYIDLNADVLAENPKGLGIKYSYKKYENHIYGEEKIYEPITMQLHFLKNAYQQYTNFVRFIYRYDNLLSLAYSYGGDYRYCDVHVDQISKTEKTNLGILSEPITFTRLSKWYKWITTSAANTIALETDDITNDVTEDLPIIVIGSAAGEVSYNISIAGVGQIIINNVKNLYLNSETKIAKDGNENIYEKINKNYNTFLSLPKGTHKVAVSASAIATHLEIKIKKWVVD